MRQEQCTIISFSEIDRDPRVLRQVNWLLELGYEINFIGFGESAGIGVSKHHPVPVSPLLVRYFSYLLPAKIRFHLLYGRHLQTDTVETVSRSDLVVVNEPELLPKFLNAALGCPIYLDLHEDHISHAHSGFFERVAFKDYWAWQTDKLKQFVALNRFQISVTSVEEEISRRYSEAFGLPVGTIYNTPDTAQEFSSNSNEFEAIKFVHVGMARKNRGIELMLRALSKVSIQFTLDFYLVFAPVLPTYKWKLKRMVRRLGLSEKVNFQDPVPLNSMVRELTSYDVSLVIGSNATSNDLHSLPNKFFQSLQAGLMIICGPNPAVRALVEKGGLGISLSAWDVDELVESVNGLDSQRINYHKGKARGFAPQVSQSKSRILFREIISGLTSNGAS